MSNHAIFYNPSALAGVVEHTPDSPWWGNKSGYGDGVKAHTSDPTKYHYPDDRQGERIRSGHPLAAGVVIPRAGTHGESLGFDCSKAAVVHVDPDAPDGGTVVDLSRVTSVDMQRAASRAAHPHEVYYNLGRSSPQRETTPLTVPGPRPEPVRNNPLMPGQYVVPKSASDGTQVGAQTGDQSLGLRHHVQVLPDQESPVSQTPYPAPVYQPPQPSSPAAYMPPAPAPAPQVDLSQLTELLRQFLPQVIPQTAAPAPVQPQIVPRSSPTAPPQPSEPPTTVQQWSQAEHQPKDGIIAGFETLDIPFITGPVPKKPMLEVFFDFGPLGHMQSRYHELIETERVLVLVFDNRYEDSGRYLPPTSKEDPFTVACPKRKKTYTVYSSGVQFTLGCLDLVVLAISDKTNSEE